MSDFAILAQLDFMRLKNAARELMRSPARLSVWVLYAMWVCFSVYQRVAYRPHGGKPALFNIAEPLASIAAFAFLFICAEVLRRGAGGQLGAFASRADARFLTSGHLNPRSVALWLQVRSSFTVIVRSLFLIVLYSLVLNRAGNAAALAFTMACGAAIVGALPIVGLAAGVRFGIAVSRTLVAVEFLSGASVAVLALAFLSVPGAFGRLPAIAVRTRLGEAANALVTGEGLALALLLFSVVFLVILAYASAGDLYPELYAASVNSFQRRGRTRAFGRGRAAQEYALIGTDRSDTRLSGAWIILWKEWLGFRRSKYIRLSVGVSFLICLAAGVAGVFLRLGRIDESVLAGLMGPAISIVVIFTLMTSVSLAADLRKPLWWLGPDPLRVRLYAWVLSTTWRMSATTLTAACVFALGSASARVLVVVVPLALVVPVTLRAIGLATYAILPIPADQRGPLALLRMLIAVALILPAAIAAAAAFIFLHSAAAAMFAAFAVLVLQDVGLIEFASWRMNGAGWSFALAEQAA
ncbi:MAG: putative ABC exporter domain-containing protein [Candidatus Eremiobacteraeota bacterium]|nr:putative ABC exporter domain-containing protein [Candidatus Eremiobacteraeota bacterium]